MNNQLTTEGSTDYKLAKLGALLLESNDLAEHLVVELCRTILRRNKKFTRCYLVNGVCFFTIEAAPPYGHNIDNISLWRHTGKGREVEPERPSFKKLCDFMLKYDKHFSLTGMGIRFKADGPIEYNW